MKRIYCWIFGHLWEAVKPAPKFHVGKYSGTLACYQPYERKCYTCGKVEEIMIGRECLETLRDEN